VADAEQQVELAVIAVSLNGLLARYRIHSRHGHLLVNQTVFGELLRLI